MKINGTKLDAHYVETVVIPRPEGNIVFNAKAVDYVDFENICPVPKAPTVQRPGKDAEPDYTNPKYLAARNKWAMLKTDYMFVKSLEATQEITWETVDIADPETWGNLSKELLETGFTDGEVTRIFNIVISINGLDDSKINKATEDYLNNQE